MHPILKDWLQNLGCFLPIGFFGFCMAITVHWVATETGPARALIIWQARLLEGQYSSRLTMAIFLLPALLGAWLLSIGCRRVLTRMGAYDRPPNSGSFKGPNGHI